MTTVLKAFESPINLEQSIKQDIKEGVLDTKIAQSLSFVDTEDKPEYKLEFKKVGNSFVAELPEEVKKRRAANVRMEDYFVVSDKIAEELL